MKEKVSYRYMRVIVMFDLPVDTSNALRVYQKFHKYLICSGFMMMQKSVYCKLTLNMTVANAVIDGIKSNRPIDGLVEVFTLTEKQFSKIEFITGTATSDVLASENRLVIL